MKSCLIYCGVFIWGIWGIFSGFYGGGIYAQSSGGQIRIKIHSNVNGETLNIDTIINGLDGYNGLRQEFNFTPQTPNSESLSAPLNQPERGSLADKLHNRNAPAPGNNTGEVFKEAALGVVIMQNETDDDEEGVKIEQVLPGSAADKAGLLAGDLILTVNEVELYNAADLKNQIRQYQPDDEITLTIMRNAERKQLTAILQEAPPAKQNPNAYTPPSLDDFFNFDGWRNNDLLPDDFTSLLEDMRRQMEDMLRQFNPALPDDPDRWNDFPDVAPPADEETGILPAETIELKPDKLSFMADTDKRAITLGFALPQTGNLRVQIIDSSGKIVFTDEKPHFTGAYKATAPINRSVFAGSYYLKIEQQGKTFVKRFVVN